MKTTNNLKFKSLNEMSEKNKHEDQEIIVDETDTSSNASTNSHFDTELARNSYDDDSENIIR